MVFIIGGDYQGKLDYAKKTFALGEGDVFTCAGGEIDFSKRCIYKVEELARSHPEPIDFFMSYRSEWEDSILIMADIFCGVVPVDRELREWRQKAGRLSQYLSGEAERVIRVFCGLEQKLK